MASGYSVELIFTVALALIGVLTPLIIAAGVRDRALHDRVISSEKAMSDKLIDSNREQRELIDDAAETARDEFVRDRDFTAAIARLESGQRDMRAETNKSIDTIHADIRNILTALARMESKQ